MIWKMGDKGLKMLKHEKIGIGFEDQCRSIYLCAFPGLLDIGYGI